MGRIALLMVVFLLVMVAAGIGYGFFKPYVAETSTTTVTLYSTETVTSLVVSTVTVRDVYTATLTSTCTLQPVTVTTTEVRVDTVTETSTVTTTVSGFEGGVSPVRRSFDIHLVRENVWVRVSVEVSPDLVDEYFGVREPVYVGGEVEVYSRLIVEAAGQAPIYNLAVGLWGLAGGDLELYGAYLFQLINQMSYNFSKANLQYVGVQPPLTTLIEGCGVCADFALLYASMLRVVNASFVIVEVNVWDYDSNILNQSHLMIGIKLSEKPSLPSRYHSYFIEALGCTGEYSITVGNETYYIVDPTPSGYVFLEEPGGKMFPPTSYYPAFIGENLWDKVEVVKVFHVED